MGKSKRPSRDAKLLDDELRERLRRAHERCEKRIKEREQNKEYFDRINREFRAKFRHENRMRTSDEWEKLLNDLHEKFNKSFVREEFINKLKAVCFDLTKDGSCSIEDVSKRFKVDKTAISWLLKHDFVPQYHVEDNLVRRKFKAIK